MSGASLSPNPSSSMISRRMTMKRTSSTRPGSTAGSTRRNGSTVGYFDAPFAETTVAHSGKQSMPMAYSNTEGFLVSRRPSVRSMYRRIGRTSGSRACRCTSWATRPTPADSSTSRSTAPRCPTVARRGSEDHRLDSLDDRSDRPECAKCEFAGDRRRRRRGLGYAVHRRYPSLSLCQ